MKEDKRKLSPALRAFKDGLVDIDYTLDFILSVCSNSKCFNQNSFALGLVLGGTIALIILFIIG